MSVTLDLRALRDAFSRFATGVTIVTGRKPGGEPVGVTVNSFSSVSLSPPLLLWCLQRESTSLDAFTMGRAFAVHVLQLAQEREAMRFARRAAVKFPAGTDEAGEVPPLIEGALCRFDCTVEAQHDGGDHLIIVGQVTHFVQTGGDPLVFQDGVFGRFTPLPRARHVEAWETFSGDWF
ncbi:MAG: flavin reductase family protein [Steroidobacteraceae bacterium]|nr:flavin reductase family protein [Steroidobacteraceae bacterium]